MQRNGKLEAHARRKRLRRAAMAMKLRNREKKVWEGLEEKDMVIRQVSLDSSGLRGRDMKV